MVAPIERLTVEQFASLLAAVKATLTRKITAVHLHHTWRPRRTDFRGRSTVEAMRRFHMVDNGWSDIAQHLTIDPQGGLWTGRNFNAPPASQTGRNGTRLEGPFMIEMVGDFDRNAETLDGLQYQAVLKVCAHLLDEFGLQTDDIHFHRELGSPKTCPGTGVDKAALVADVQRTLTELPALEAAPSGARSARAKRARAPFRADAVVGYAVAAPWDGPAQDATVPEGERAADAVARLSVPIVAGSGAVTRDADEWAMLRPHVINLSKGVLSRSGSFKMLPGALEGIIDAIRDYAVATDAPKVMLHAHGGLVGERSALEYARTAVPWWKDQGIYPVYFVWETSAFEVIKQRLGIRGLGDAQDWLFEQVARKAAAWAWGDMKDSALLASSADADEGEAGGAFLFAGLLASLVTSKPAGKDLSLHAVGHSAGAIFHAHLVPLLVAKHLTIDSLSVLAPAVRNDLFTSHLLPLAKAKTIKQVLMCTMTEEAEREDDLIEPAGIPIYGKSLLYLISRAFEPKRKTPILGLEQTLQEELLAFFSGGGGRLELSPSAGNPPNPNCTARRHGCFDNDTPTMRTVAGLIRADGTQPAAPFPGGDGCERARGRRRQADTLAVMAGATGRPGGPVVGGGPSPIASGTRRALCVGIDRYTTSPLAGCVRDARNWGGALGSLGFTVTTLLDEQATRAGILAALTDLVSTASAGDVLVFQYAGHGTQVPDEDGDDADGFDEAFVPIDVDSGALLLDDDLAEVYARLPRGAVLTLFMDCCHSGTNSRFAPRAAATATGRERRRFLPLSPWLEQAHRLFRSRMGPASRAANAATASLDGIVHVAACQDNQYAYELDGAGNFTRIAAAALVDAVHRGETNEAFVARMASAVEALGNPQTPGLMKLPAGLTNLPLLAGGSAGRPAQPGPFTGAAGTGGDRPLVYHLTEALRLAGGRP